MNASSEILLVEDNPYDIEIMVEGFKQLGLSQELQIARDGEEALDILYRRGRFQRKQPGNPSLVILDVRMPKVNGIEVLHFMKNDDTLKEIPVVILTSYPEVQSIPEVSRLAAAFIEKPADYDEMLTVLKRILTFRASKTKEQLAA